MDVVKDQINYNMENTTSSILLSLLLGKKVSNALGKFASWKDLAKAVTKGKIKELTDLQQNKIKAILELGKRIKGESIKGKIIDGPQKVYEIYGPKLKDKKRENIYTLSLDTKNMVIDEKLISIGSLNLSIVHPREVFLPAITNNAQSVIILHNHPSGKTLPSREDIGITKRLAEVGKIIGIEVIDHIIIGDDYYSFKQNNQI